MQQPCAVFWDIENCGVPNGIRCFELVRRLKTLLQQIHQKNFGFVYQFLEIIAVGNLKQIPDVTRKELQDSGVVTIDCASGKPSAADISLLIEIMKFTHKHPFPASIVLVSSDGDFAKCVQYLDSVGYSVMVLYGQNASESLKCGPFLSVPFRSIWADEPSRSFSGIPGSKKSKKAGASQSLYVPVHTSSKLKEGYAKKSKPKTSVTLKKPTPKESRENHEKSGSLVVSTLTETTLPSQPQDGISILESLSHSDDHRITDDAIEDTLNEGSHIADGELCSDTSSTDSYFEDIVYLKTSKSIKENVLKHDAPVDPCGYFVEDGNDPPLQALQALEIVQEHSPESYSSYLQESES